jgi:hypothetical protein
MQNTQAYNSLRNLTDSMQGGTFASIDTITDVKLTGGKKNIQQGRVQKQVIASRVQVFQNKSTNAYEAKVKRELVKEDKLPSNFKLSPRQWGERVKDAPYVEHKGNYYLEVIFLKAGVVTYLLDGAPIDKADVQGIPVVKASGQGGLQDQVIIRTYACNNITGIRVLGQDVAL